MTAPTSTNGPAVTLTLRVFRERYSKLRTWELLAELKRRGVVRSKSTPAYVRNVEGGWKKPAAEVLDAWLDILDLPAAWLAVPGDWGDLLGQVAELRAARQEEEQDRQEKALAA
jgi:hypothetical protein